MKTTMERLSSWLDRGIGRLSTPSKAKRGRPRSATRLQVERLEERLTPTLSSYDVYALTIVNEMRANPAAFGQELKQLYANPNYVAPDGVRGNSAAWQQLRQEINQVEANSSWRSGFNSSGSNTFLNVISSLPSTRPLVAGPGIDGVDLQSGAENHTNWMFQNGYLAHSLLGNNPLDLSAPLPDRPQVHNPTPDSYSGDFSRGENIGNEFYSAGLNSSFNLQQAVYIDVISYMLEFHNDSPTEPWGHLFNFAAYDPVSAPSGLGLSESPKSNQLSVFNVVGAAESEFTNTQGAAWILSTYRLGLDSSNSYIAGVAYSDTNRNGAYDPGEGLPATVELDYGQGFKSSAVYNIQGNTGYFYFQIPSTAWGQPFEVSASYNGHKVFSYNSSTLDAGNRFFNFDFSHVLGLGLVNGANPNTTPQTATNLGTASTTSAIPDIIHAQTIVTPSEQDWYSFSLVGQQGANNTIAIAFDPSGAQAQGTLYSPGSNGQLHSVSIPESTNSTGQSLSLSGLQPGQYYLAVSAVSGGTPTYSLQVQVGAAPTLAPIGQQTVGAGGNVTFTASPVGSTTGQTLTYSLDTGAPAGATINPTTGVFNWTPTAAQAGQTYTFNVRVTENGNSGLSSTETVTVVVSQITTTTTTTGGSSSSTTANNPTLQKPSLLALFDQLLGAIESVNNNGTETVTDYLFGSPLFVSTYDSSGALMSVTIFGIDVTFLFA